MDRGHHRHAGTSRLLRRIGFRPAHLSDHDDIGIKAECHIQKRDLIYPLALILTSFFAYGQLLLMTYRTDGAQVTQPPSWKISIMS